MATNKNQNKGATSTKKTVKEFSLQEKSKELQAQLQAEKNKAEADCLKEIGVILDKFGCILQCEMTLSDDAPPRSVIKIKKVK